MTKYQAHALSDLVRVTKALADESRVRILAALRAGEVCVCQLTELLELAPSTVSKHLALLRAAGLVEMRKQGRWAFYRLPGRGAGGVVRRALALLGEGLREDQRSARDEKRLARILRAQPETLCSEQRGGGRR